MSAPSTVLELPAHRFAIRLEQMRASGRRLLDLAQSDPAHCGLAWDPGELAALPGDGRSTGPVSGPRGRDEAREAVARYLSDRKVPMVAGHVFIARSTDEALRLLLQLVCDAGDELLVPSPWDSALDRLAEAASLRLVRYPLRYGGSWRLDRRAVARAVTDRTRAIVSASPCEPSGAVLSSEELRFLEDLCAARGLALVGEELHADAAFEAAPSVADTHRCLAFHVSSLAGVCGLAQVGVAWLAVSGPKLLVEGALARLDVLAGAVPSAAIPAQLALPALLTRRHRFLEKLRARLAQNRASIATTVLREAPFSLLESGGGWSAVIQIGAAEDEEAVALALLEDGVVVRPGCSCGFERGHLVVSLLPVPAVFRDGLAHIEAQLRRPLFG